MSILSTRNKGSTNGIFTTRQSALLNRDTTINQNNLISKANQKIEELKKILTEIQERLNVCEEDIGGLDVDLVEASNNIETLRNEINTIIDEKVTDINTKIGNIEEKDKTQDSNITTMENNIKDTIDGLNALTSRVGAIETKDDNLENTNTSNLETAIKGYYKGCLLYIDSAGVKQGVNILEMFRKILPQMFVTIDANCGVTLTSFDGKDWNTLQSDSDRDTLVTYIKNQTDTLYGNKLDHHQQIANLWNNISSIQEIIYTLL